MAWNAFFVFFVSSMWVVTSMEGYYQPPRGSLVWGYFTPPLLHREPPDSHRSAMDAMVDLTNNLGVAILQDNTFSKGNFAFSPYGVASVLVVLYEGARGESARQIHRAVGFPSDKDIIRVGFRDIHRHLRSYFSHEGYLSGISLNKETSSLKPEYKRVLRFYGYDIDLGQTDDDEDGDVGLEKPSTTEGSTTKVSMTPLSTSSPSSSTSQDVGKPDSGDSVTENTTTVENTIKEINTTTVSTATTEINTTVSPTERPEAVTEASQSSSEPQITTDGVKPTSEPQTTADEFPVENTKPAESVTEPEKASDVENTKPAESVTEPEKTSDVENTKPAESVTEPEKTSDVENTKPTESVTEPEKTSDVENTKPAENDVTTDKSPPDDANPENVATEQQMQTTIEPTDANNQTTVTEQPANDDMISSTTTSKPEPSTVEVIKATTTLNLTTESDTNKITTTTEPVNSQTELQPPSTVENMSSGTERDNDRENKEMSTTAVENTTESLKQDTEVTDTSSEQPPLTSTPSTLKNEVTEAVTTAETTIKEAEVTTTESVKTEEFTNSPLDNGMLIPQSEDSAPTKAAEKVTEPSPTSTSAFKEEATNETVKGTTDSRPQDTNSLPESERLLSEKNVIKMSGRILTPEHKKRIRNIVDTRVPLWLVDVVKSRRPRTITDYLKSPRSPDLSLQLQNGMYDTHVSRNTDLYRSLPRLLFLVDGAIDTPVPMMTYTNTFPYTYVPKLHAKALEFPLDDIRYKLLILLPVERRGLRQLIYDLLDYPLNNVLAAMKPARVKAIVPTFMVEGFVILTSSLQKLGIWDVFDPRKANLSAMSMDPELYVRNVEQSVTVVIRNYVEILDIQTRTMAARYMEYEFEATHPFLYFVLDTSTNVALMAGQILDPLNSRIY